jgi:hypothetical protein
MVMVPHINELKIWFFVQFLKKISSFDLENQIQFWFGFY